MPKRATYWRYDPKKGEVVEVKHRHLRRNIQGQWPIYSDALGVNPRQVPEANETMRRLGLKPNYQADGTYKLESRQHRREHCQHPEIQVYDRDGGYGDPMPPQRTYRQEYRD